MNLEDIPSLYWTDSSAALFWIQHEDHWGTFVKNRVEEIRNLSSKEAWKHLPGTCYPADLPSRGCSILQIYGNFTTASLDVRFVENYRQPDKRVTSHLTDSELDAAEKVLVKTVQQEILKNENVESRLKTLCIFTDSNGLIRLKTKITRRDDAEDFISPLLLSSDHPLVERLIFKCPLQSSYAGTQVVLTDIRQKRWLFWAERLSKEFYRRDRIREALVFEITGVDLAGPLHLRDGKKAWILLFTWAVYKAINLELIQSFSTNGFLLGFRRFIARRERPKIIYSDNGTNFTGAINWISALDWYEIVDVASVLRIQWKFDLLTAAWWGGFWERLIQMVKKLLRRVLGKASLSYEEIFTILCDIEATLNSRPLNCYSEDPNDLTPLTLSMFIQETRTVGVPDLDNLDKINISKGQQYQQALRDNLRKRFRDEYLSMLVQRPNRSEAREVKLGDIVIVVSDTKKRLDWPLGKIIGMFPGKDGCTRVVKLKTTGGEIVRPVQRLFPLELNNDDPIIFSVREPVPFDKYIKILISENSDCEKKTRSVKQPSEGLATVNTRLEWTVMGKLSSESKFEVGNFLLVHSLLTNREKLSDLWKLDSLGIKDPSEKKSKLEFQDLALKHFENTVLRDDEGRYIVTIPWNEGVKDSFCRDFLSLDGCTCQLFFESAKRDIGKIEINSIQINVKLK
ncbi:histone H3.3 [Trichonephila clavipes]|nr:histone H3.3 [Trichonephila clavipes]